MPLAQMLFGMSLSLLVLEYRMIQEAEKVVVIARLGEGYSNASDKADWERDYENAIIEDTRLHSSEVAYSTAILIGFQAKIQWCQEIISIRKATLTNIDNFIIGKDLVIWDSG